MTNDFKRLAGQLAMGMNFYAVLNVNDRCMDFDCRCNRVKFMDGFVVFQEHTNENDVTLAIIPKESILFIATE